MIDRKHYGIVAFPSSQAAGQAELTFEEAGRKSRLIPLPPQLSAGCGLVLQFEWTEREETAEFMKETRIPYTEIYEVTLTKQRKKKIQAWKEKGGR